MSAGERELLLDQLRTLDSADWGVLSNVRCVAEGVDVPTLDGVVFIDPRRSQIEVIQAVGRAIRRSPEKRLGFVVIPVFIPPGATDEDVLDSSEFRAVWAVVRALRAHDDVLAEQLDAARFQLGLRGGAIELSEKIILDLPRTVSADFARSFSARIVRRSTSSLEFWFGLLSGYVEWQGTVERLRRDYVDRGHELGPGPSTNGMPMRGSAFPRTRGPSGIASGLGLGDAMPNGIRCSAFWNSSSSAKATRG